MTLAIIYVLARTSTLSDFIDVANGANLSSLIFATLFYRFTEFGELFVNIPVSKIPAEFHFMMPWIGLLALLLMLFGFLTKRREIGPTEVFLICYMAILFVWRFNDTKFWLPVIPLLTAYSLLAVKRLELPNTLVAIYCLVFATFGLTALIYSTGIGLAGSAFPDRYGDGQLRPTYCAAFKSCNGSWDSEKADANALRLLREYD
jgi:hypothetical protein